MIAIPPLARAVGHALALTSALAAAALAGPPDVVRPELATSLRATIDLEAGWRDPPAAARTRCWWWWLNGNVTKAAITRDLEQMHAKGLGGANIVDAGGADQRGNRQVPHGPDFASPEWRELFLHALREADRLGLELGFNIQSGWNLGGPTVRPEIAAKKLASSELTVDGGRLVERQLRQPRSVAAFYRDIALLALPVGEGAAGPARLQDAETRAYYRYPGSFVAADASHLMDVPADDANRPAPAADAILDISASLDEDGQLSWQAPPGRWRLVRLGYTLAGSRVSTHSEGWDGWAIDYLDADAFDEYWRDVAEPLLDAAGPLVGRSLKFLHTDSWELGPVNWTPKLPEQFLQLRGYDMRPYLATLAGYVVDDAETSTRFLNDFRRTLAELIAEGKYGAFARRAHARGLGVHPESGGPHAAPVDSLLCLGRSDIPMGEFWARAATHRVRDFERLFVKQAGSAAHIYGKRLVLAESFTSIGPHWEEDPADLKPEFDRVACEGLNLVMLHTFDCSPDEMGVPGQNYFAGTHINPHTTWWPRAGAFFDYLNRCQFLLQQGLPVADVLYFYGENVPSFVRLKRDDPAGVLPGYDYDVINCEAFVERTRVENGRIVLPDGVSYAVLALPPGGKYGLAALEQIAELVEGGARVVGEKPARPMGLVDAASDQRFRDLADRLWSTDGAASGASGRKMNDASAREALEAAGVMADFEFVPADRDVNPEILDYVHRRTDDAEIYFVINRTDRPVAAECWFRVIGRRPELWDPVTGATVDAAAFEQSEEAKNSGTKVPLEFPAYGSLFVVFRDSISSTTRGAGRTNHPRLARVLGVEGPWTVTFDPRWGGPAEATFDELADWTTRPEDEIRYYSGPAVYRGSFELSSDATAGSERARLFLDLGRVENLAAVTLNDRPLGVAWTPPYRVEITDAVQPGRNRLSVEVVNLWPNRLIGDQRLPRGERLTRTNITKFNADSPLLPSGLLGPVEVLRRDESPAGGGGRPGGIEHVNVKGD